MQKNTKEQNCPKNTRFRTILKLSAQKKLTAK